MKLFRQRRRIEPNIQHLGQLHQGKVVRDDQEGKEDRLFYQS
jgi:hypothetical protein